MFDERLVRNQDYEFNRRLARAGKRIWLNPAIRVQYYNQATLGGLFRQAFGTGKWNPWMWHVAHYSFAPRHLVPGLFVAVVLSYIVHRSSFLLAAILVPYFVLAFLASFQQAKRYGSKSVSTFSPPSSLHPSSFPHSSLPSSSLSRSSFIPPPFLLFLSLPFLFFAYHFSYGLGTLWGALRLLLGATPVQRTKRG